MSYCIYDIKDKEQCVAVFDTVKEVAEYFNTTKSTIFRTISRKSIRDKRYLIEKVEV